MLLLGRRGALGRRIKRRGKGLSSRKIVGGSPRPLMDVPSRTLWNLKAKRVALYSAGVWSLSFEVLQLASSMQVEMTEDNALSWWRYKKWKYSSVMLEQKEEGQEVVYQAAKKKLQTKRPACKYVLPRLIRLSLRFWGS